MDKAKRKALVRDYLERKPETGVFAIKCSATGEAWVGWSTSLDKRKNSFWFQLGAGADPTPGMQKAWKAHGGNTFSYEVLEEVSEDNPHALKDRLEERAKHWREKLNAPPLPSR